MNERIRELAEQAGEHANLVYVPPVRSKTPGKIWEDGHIDWHDLFNQKFAELIVKECASICDSYGMPDGTSQTAMILSSTIKKRFGVK